MNLTAVIPTRNRWTQLKQTLERIRECEPAPAEIIVHVDGGDYGSAERLRREFPGVKLITSPDAIGPGGGRNKLVREANTEWVVSFDDDSWPLERSFFASVAELAKKTKASLIACQIVERDQQPDKTAVANPYPTSTFVGCGCVYRKSDFLATDGFVPLPLAYGMEENDLSLKLIENGCQIAYAPELLVQHGCDRETHQSNPKINAAHISNTALKVFLRYPLLYWPLGSLQVANRFFYSIGKRRFRGTLRGLFCIAGHCWKFRDFRKPVSTATINTFRRLSRQK